MAFAIQYDKLYGKSPKTISNATYNEHKFKSTSTTNTDVAQNYFQILVAGNTGSFTQIFSKSTNGYFEYIYTIPTAVARFEFCFHGNVVNRYIIFDRSDLDLTSGGTIVFSGTISGLGTDANSGKVYGVTITYESAPIHDFNTLYHAMATVSEACNVGQIPLTTGSGNIITSPSDLSGLYTYQCIPKNKCSSAGCSVRQSSDIHVYDPDNDHDLTYENNQMVRFYDLAKKTQLDYHFYADVNDSNFGTVSAQSQDGRGATTTLTQTYPDVDDGMNATYINVDAGSTYNLNIFFIVSSAGDYTITLTPMSYHSTSGWVKNPVKPVLSDNIEALPRVVGYGITGVFTDLTGHYLIEFDLAS